MGRGLVQKDGGGNIPHAGSGEVAMGTMAVKVIGEGTGTI